MKMYCVFSEEAIAKMGGNRGKLAAMAGHAFLHAFWNADDSGYSDIEWAVKMYRFSGAAKKVVLITQTTDDLRALEAAYKGKTGVSLVTDSARTVFTEPTTCCIGLGPFYEEGDDLDQRDGVMQAGADLLALKVLK